MARAKTQLTGFARFFIFLLIAAPMIFFGVSYYKGEDPMQTLRATFGESTSVTHEEPAKEEIATPPSKTAINSELAKLRDEMEFKENRINDLYKENEELKAELQKKEAELEEVQSQLNKIKSAIGQ